MVFLLQTNHHHTPSRKSSRSHGAILRSKYVKPLMIPISPYDITKLAHSWTTIIGRHLESAIQTELVVEPDIPLIGRKQYCRILSYARKIQKSSCWLVCRDKIEKPRVKTFIVTISPKLHHSNPNSFGVNVHLRQFFLNGYGHRKVT